MEIRKYLMISLFLLLGGLFVSGGQVVVKDGNLNVTEDFLVDSNVLYVNSSSNYVGIGTTTPGSALDVIEPGNANVYENGIRANRPDAQGQYAFMGYGQASQDAYFGSVYTGGGTGVYGAIHLRQYNSAMTARDVLNIDTSGLVGIGETTPGAPLEVVKTVSSGIAEVVRLSNNGGGVGTGASLTFYDQDVQDGIINTAYTDAWTLNLGTDAANPTTMTLKNGKVGIGTTSPGYKLEVAGQAAKQGPHWVDLSDERLKEGIIPIPNALNTVLSLNGREFGYKDKTKFGADRRYGFIAQDVEKVIPQWVLTGSDGYKSLNIMGDSALLVEAIKEQQTQIEEQQQQIDKLESENNFLKSDICKKDNSYAWC